MKKLLALIFSLIPVVAIAEAEAQLVTSDSNARRISILTSNPNQPINLIFLQAPLLRRVVANDCGLLVVSRVSVTNVPNKFG